MSSKPSLLSRLSAKRSRGGELNKEDQSTPTPSSNIQSSSSSSPLLSTRGIKLMSKRRKISSSSPQLATQSSSSSTVPSQSNSAQSDGEPMDDACESVLTACASSSSSFPPPPTPSSFIPSFIPSSSAHASASAAEDDLLNTSSRRLVRLIAERRLLYAVSYYDRDAPEFAGQMELLHAVDPRADYRQLALTNMSDKRVSSTSRKLLDEIIRVMLFNDIVDVINKHHLGSTILTLARIMLPHTIAMQMQVKHELPKMMSKEHKRRTQESNRARIASRPFTPVRTKKATRTRYQEGEEEEEEQDDEEEAYDEEGKANEQHEQLEATPERYHQKKRPLFSAELDESAADDDDGDDIDDDINGSACTTSKSKSCRVRRRKSAAFGADTTFVDFTLHPGEVPLRTTHGGANHKATIDAQVDKILKCLIFNKRIEVRARSDDPPAIPFDKIPHRKWIKEVVLKRFEEVEKLMTEGKIVYKQMNIIARTPLKGELNIYLSKEDANRERLSQMIESNEKVKQPAKKKIKVTKVGKVENDSASPSFTSTSSLILSSSSSSSSSSLPPSSSLLSSSSLPSSSSILPSSSQLQSSLSTCYIMPQDGGQLAFIGLKNPFIIQRICYMLFNLRSAYDDATMYSLLLIWIDHHDRQAPHLQVVDLRDILRLIFASLHKRDNDNMLPILVGDEDDQVTIKYGPNAVNIAESDSQVMRCNIVENDQLCAYVDAGDTKHGTCEVRVFFKTKCATINQLSHLTNTNSASLVKPILRKHLPRLSAASVDIICNAITREAKNCETVRLNFIREDVHIYIGQPHDDGWIDSSNDYESANGFEINHDETNVNLIKTIMTPRFIAKLPPPASSLKWSNDIDHQLNGGSKDSEERTTKRQSDVVPSHRTSKTSNIFALASTPTSARRGRSKTPVNGRIDNLASSTVASSSSTLPIIFSLSARSAPGSATPIKVTSLYKTADLSYLPNYRIASHTCVEPSATCETPSPSNNRPLAISIASASAPAPSTPAVSLSHLDVSPSSSSLSSLLSTVALMPSRSEANMVTSSSPSPSPNPSLTELPAGSIATMSTLSPFVTAEVALQMTSSPSRFDAASSSASNDSMPVSARLLPSMEIPSHIPIASPRLSRLDEELLRITPGPGRYIIRSNHLPRCCPSILKPRCEPTLTKLAASPNAHSMRSALAASSIPASPPSSSVRTADARNSSLATMHRGAQFTNTTAALSTALHVKKESDTNLVEEMKSSLLCITPVKMPPSLSLKSPSIVKPSLQDRSRRSPIIRDGIGTITDENEPESLLQKSPKATQLAADSNKVPSRRWNVPGRCIASSPLEFATINNRINKDQNANSESASSSINIKPTERQLPFRASILQKTADVDDAAVVATLLILHTDLPPLLSSVITPLHGSTSVVSLSSGGNHKPFAANSKKGQSGFGKQQKKASQNKRNRNC